MEQVAGLRVTQSGSRAAARQCVHLVLLHCKARSSTEAGSEDKIRGLSSTLGMLQKPAQPAAERELSQLWVGVGRKSQREEGVPICFKVLNSQVRKKKTMMIDNTLLSTHSNVHFSLPVGNLKRLSLIACCYSE